MRVHSNRSGGRFLRSVVPVASNVTVANGLTVCAESSVGDTGASLSVSVRVAFRSVRPRTWLAKAATSTELVGNPHYTAAVISALAIITSSVVPVRWR